jgi:IclR helix-turn-helix domain
MTAIPVLSAPSTRAAAKTRQAEIAPLWKAGLSIREISERTGIPRSAAHRAVTQLEKAETVPARLPIRKSTASQPALQPEVQGPVTPARDPASPSEIQLPVSCVMSWTVDGIPLDVRRLIVMVRERAVEGAVKRGLLDRDDRNKPWVIVSALFANLFSDTTIEWLRRHGWQGDPRSTESIIAAVNETFAKLPR